MYESAANKSKLLPLVLLLCVLGLGSIGWFGYSLWSSANRASSGWREANDEMQELLLQQSGSRAEVKAKNANETSDPARPPSSEKGAKQPEPGSVKRESDSKAASSIEAPAAEERINAQPPTGETAPMEPVNAALSSAKQQNEAKLPLNTATAQQLTAIPGIGDSKAKAIIAHREQIGRFQRVEQLLDVKGIGEKLLEKMRPYVTVEP